jgi:proteasome lid subunit RPN8/RPN11
MNTLIFTPAQIMQMRREAERAYPNECCGAFIGREEGRERRVERLRALANSFEVGETYHRFSLDPLELAQVEKEAGGEGMLVLGFYHSHPDHPARPSEYDRQHAWPFYSYVIVAVAAGRSTDITSWQLDEPTEQFQRQTLLPGEEIARQR